MACTTPHPIAGEARITLQAFIEMTWLLGSVVMLCVVGTAGATDYTIGTFAGHDGTTLNQPLDVAVAGTSTVYIADSQNHRVLKAETDGTISTVAGTGGRQTAAQLNWPYGLAVDSTGAVYIADEVNYRVRKVAPDGIITTVAGQGLFGNRGDGGPATAAFLNRPTGVAVASDGTVHIADSHNNRVRRLTPPLSDDATLHTLALTGIDVGVFTNDVTAYTATIDHAIATTTVITTPNPCGRHRHHHGCRGQHHRSLTDGDSRRGRHHCVEHRHGGRRTDDADIHDIRDPSTGDHTRPRASNSRLGEESSGGMVRDADGRRRHLGRPHDIRLLAMGCSWRDLINEHFHHRRCGLPGSIHITPRRRGAPWHDGRDPHGLRAAHRRRCIRSAGGFGPKQQSSRRVLVGRPNLHMDFRRDVPSEYHARPRLGPAIPERQASPPMASFRLVPERHNGVDAFTFRTYFSEEIAMSYKTLRDAVFSVTGGRVTGDRRGAGR